MHTDSTANLAFFVVPGGRSAAETAEDLIPQPRLHHTPRPMPRPSKRAQEAELWGGLLRAHNLINDAVAADLEREAGMPVVWYEVLLVLSNAEAGQLRLQDLEHCVLQSQSGISRLIDRMARAGYVTRQPVAEDRRGVCAHITPAGRHAFRRAAPVYVNAIHRHFLSHMTGDEKATVQDVLTRIQQTVLTQTPC